MKQIKNTILKTFIISVVGGIGLIIGYFSIFAALDWTNLNNNVTNNTTLTADMWNANMTAIKNNTDSLSSNYFIKQEVVQVDTATYNFGTTWGIGPNFATISGFKAGSQVKITYIIPARNDSTGWGGGYIEPQISFNGGTTWNSLGSSGYDAGVMVAGVSAIGSYTNTIVVNPGLTTDFSVKMRFYFRSYDGTLTINGSNALNSVSGTAPIMTGNNGTQHYSKVIVEELATY